MTKNWFYDAIVYIYALSLLFYFSDFVGANQRAKRMGTGLLSFVWSLQFVYLAVSLYGSRTMLDFTLLETLLLYSWLLITLSLVIHRFFRIDLFVFLVNLFGFAVLLLPAFFNPSFSTTIPGALFGDKLLFAHAALAIVSYAAFAVAAVFSGMYLFLHRQLKEKNWSQTMKRLPSLEVIHRYTGYAVIAGAPLLLISMALGFVRLWLQGDVRVLFDSKVLNSIIVLGAYAFYIIQRFSLRIPGVRLAAWNLAAFAVVLINLIVSNYYSAFHQWIGR